MEDYFKVAFTSKAVKCLEDHGEAENDVVEVKPQLIPNSMVTLIAVGSKCLKKIIK